MTIWHTFTQAQHVLAGVLAMITLITWRAPRHGLERGEGLAIFGLAGAAGALGARALWWALHQPRPVGELVAITSGFSSLGAVMAAGAAGLLAARALGARHTREVLDLFAPAGLIGLGLARLGCLAQGCDFGVPASAAPGAFAYTQPGSPAFAYYAASAGLERTPELFPLALYLGAWAVVCGLAGVWLTSRLAPGRAGVAALAAYSAGRLVLEFWRAPPPQGWLNASQFVIIGAWILATIMVTMRATKPAHGLKR